MTPEDLIIQDLRREIENTKKDIEKLKEELEIRRKINDEMLQKIAGSTIISPFDLENGNASVYIGGLADLKRIDPEWRTVKHPELGESEELTLDEIVAQVSQKYGYNKLITIIINDLLFGEILQYGNHGAYWEKIGDICGYA